MRSLLMIPALGLLCSGCTGPAKGTRSPANETTAHKLYAAKCAKCHKFYDPARYSDEQWQTWFDKMSKKAKLNPAQAQELAAYIEKTFRHPQPSP